MPQIILSPRETVDIRQLAQAATLRSWTLSKLTSWRVPTDLAVLDEIAIYGEQLFARVIAAQNNHVLLEPPPSWLAELPFDVTHRKIKIVHAVDLKQMAFPLFVKPPDDKLY